MAGEFKLWVKEQQDGWHRDYLLVEMMLPTKLSQSLHLVGAHWPINVHLLSRHELRSKACNEVCTLL